MRTAYHHTTSSVVNLRSGSRQDNQYNEGACCGRAGPVCQAAHRDGLMGFSLDEQSAGVSGFEPAWPSEGVLAKKVNQESEGDGG